MRPLRFPTAAIGLACAMAFAPALGGAGRARPSPDAKAHSVGRPQSPQELVRKVLSQGALEQGWTDLGWAQHSLSPGRPARVDFSGYAGWIFSSAQLKPDFGGLLIRYRAPASFGDFLEVYLDSRTRPAFPRVHPGAEARTVDPDGWTSFWIPMSAVDPLEFPFDRLVLRAARSVGPEPVEIETIAFTGAAPLTEREREILRTPPRKARVTLDCGKTQPISPLIYGVSFGDVETAAELGASARRWGGNPASRYNWKLGNAWNTGKDWFFRNVAMGKDNPPWDIFLAQDRAQGRTTAFTLPMLGWVAKDTVACGFPAALYSDQKRFDPDTNRCGDGVAGDGSLLPSGSPSASSSPAPPSFIAEWVRAIRAKDPPPRSARLYYLDNEPTLWHLTHRDVHPERLSAEELVERTIAYGTAVRLADPEARIAGLVAWGWTALFYSATDKAEGSSFVPTDRLKHGGRPLVPWWLSQLRAHDAKSGLRTVDVVDVHFYPQAAGVGLYEDGWIDPEGSARRIRSVRALWDPTYRDESWIGEPMKLIPRLRAWIDQEYPGLGISIGEYNLGAERHISGGLALAEALGQFGLNGVEAAFYWALPPRGSAAYWAFRAFRNYDGKGARVGDLSVAVHSTDKGLSSIFATQKADGTLVLIALNHEPQKPLELEVQGGSCGPLRTTRVFSYSGEGGLKPESLTDEARRGRDLQLSPWSINVLEMRPVKGDAP